MNHVVGIQSGPVLRRDEWWAARKRLYNIILIVAAPISGILLFVVWALFEDRLPCLEITGFSIVFGMLLFSLGLGVANLCYRLGSVSERIVGPQNPTSFRRLVFGLGVALSLLVIFSPPLLNLIAALFIPPAQMACEP